MFLVLATAHAGVGLDVGVGLRQVHNPYSGRYLSLAASARRHVGHYVAIEGGGTVLLPLGDEISGLTHVLIAFAEDYNADNFSQPINTELGAVLLHAQVSPWKNPHNAQVGMWPYAVVGVEVRFVDYAHAELNPAYALVAAGADPAAIPADSHTLRVLPSPTIGLGFDVWFADRVGVRIVVSERFALEEEPDYGERTTGGDPVPLETILTTSGAATVSAMVRF